MSVGVVIAGFVVAFAIFLSVSEATEQIVKAIDKAAKNHARAVVHNNCERWEK